jgi:hypothetical protein
MARENIIEKLRNYDKSDLLNALGIETEASWGEFLGPVLGAFGVGMLVGAGLGLLFAPQAGRQTRQDIRQRFSRAAEQVQEGMREQFASDYDRNRQDVNAPNVVPNTPGPM